MVNDVSCYNEMDLTNSRSIPWFFTKTKPTVVNAEFNLATKLSSDHGNSVPMSTTGISDISFYYFSVCASNMYTDVSDYGLLLLTNYEYGFPDTSFNNTPRS